MCVSQHVLCVRWGGVVLEEDVIGLSRFCLPPHQLIYCSDHEDHGYLGHHEYVTISLQS